MSVVAQPATQCSFPLLREPDSPLMIYEGHHCRVVQSNQDVVPLQLWLEGFESHAIMSRQLMCQFRIGPTHEPNVGLAAAQGALTRFASVTTTFPLEINLQIRSTPTGTDGVISRGPGP